MVHLLRHNAPVLQEVLALRRAMKRFGRAKLAEDCSAEVQGDTWMLSWPLLNSAVPRASCCSGTCTLPSCIQRSATEAQVTTCFQLSKITASSRPLLAGWLLQAANLLLMLQKPSERLLASVAELCSLKDLAPAGCQVAADAADAMCAASSSSDADSEHSTSSGYESDASIGEITDEFGAGLSLQQKFPVQARDIPSSPKGRSSHVWKTSFLLHRVMLLPELQGLHSSSALRWQALDSCPAVTPGVSASA